MPKICQIRNHKFTLIRLPKLLINFLADVSLYFNNKIYKDMIAINNKKILVCKIIILKKLSKFKIR